MTLSAVTPHAAAERARRPSSADAVEPAIARAAAVPSGDTLTLQDGRQVRLAGIVAPRPGDGKSRRIADLAQAATDALAALVHGRVLTLRPSAGGRDRYGRLMAHVTDEQGTWLQGELLSRGLARVATTPDTRERAREMLALEDAARRARRGLWAEPDYRVLTPEESARHTDSFRIVEGRVLKVATVRNRTFLNFGPDWRTDFTAAIDAAALRLLRAADMDPRGLEGRMVRIRGWVQYANGPLIDVTHPEQIETIDP